jgi:uncharacterized damage-inducible protein DinB
MKNLLRSILIFALATAAALASASAWAIEPPSQAQSQSAPSAAPQAAAQPEDKTPPSYDMKGQALLDLDRMHQKFVALAEAIPAEKFTWRPAEGVRSIGEVFLHVSQENYTITALMGVAPDYPPVEAKGYEQSITDKPKIIDELNKAYAHSRAAVEHMTNAEFARLLPKLGPQANAGDVVYILVADNHEHMGQIVAYARMTGIIPPWTVAAQKKKAEQQKSPPKN